MTSFSFVHSLWNMLCSLGLYDLGNDSIRFKISIFFVIKLVEILMLLKWKENEH